MSFELNVQNYTLEELIDMFELPASYDASLVDGKVAKLTDRLAHHPSLSPTTRSQTIEFIRQAKRRLLEKAKPTLQDKIEDFYNSSYELKPSQIEDPQEHMVQLRPEKPYLSSFPSEFFPGVINPLKKRTIRKNLNIDTRFRENYYANTSTNFNVTLPTNFNGVVQMQLVSIELPNAVFAVSKQYGNNYFTLSVTLQDDTVSSTVVHVPSGNYTTESIMDAINLQLQQLGNPFSLVTFQVNLLNGNTGTAQTLVTSSESEVKHISLQFQYDTLGTEDRNTPLPLKFGWLLGFRNGAYFNNTAYVSEGIVDVSGPKYFFLVVDDYNANVNNGFFSAFNSSILNKNILARISNQASSFQTLQQNNLNIVTSPREYFGPINVNHLTIQLLDEYGRIVDLNNMDYSFCLTLTTAYDL